MQLNVVIHKAEEGGYWAEVPSIPGCATQGESLKDVLTNLGEAIAGCLSVQIEQTSKFHTLNFKKTVQLTRTTPEFT